MNTVDLYSEMELRVRVISTSVSEKDGSYVGRSRRTP